MKNNVIPFSWIVFIFGTSILSSRTIPLDRSAITVRGNTMKNFLNRQFFGLAPAAATPLKLEMNSTESLFELASDQQTRLHNARGWTVRALCGTVWITQDHDRRDIVLEPGETFEIDRDGVALVTPLGAARVAIERLGTQGAQVSAKLVRTQFRAGARALAA
jgi:hypothetical protein